MNDRLFVVVVCLFVVFIFIIITPPHGQPHAVSGVLMLLCKD